MSIPTVMQNRLSIPVVGAPLFIISGPELVISQCKAGVVGSFPALNARPAAMLDTWLTQINEELDAYNQANPDSPAAPFAVNQIVHNSNDRLMHDVEMCVKHKVPIVITSLGARPEVFDAIHSYGGICLHDVINNRFAKKAIEKGADGLICVAAGAGGHAGTINPMPLITEIKKFFKKTILLAGCISTGRDIASAMQMGADLAYMGTRFINTKESKAPKEYQDMIIDCGATDIVYTAAVSGVSANFLAPSLNAMGVTAEMLARKERVDFGEELTVNKDEAKAWATIWSAGQGVTTITDSPSVSDLVSDLKTEFKTVIEKQYALLDVFK